MPGGLAEALTGVDQALAGLAGVDPAGDGDRVLLDAAVALQRAANRLAAQQLRLLRAIENREAYQHDGCVSVASWLRWHTRVDYPTASRMVYAARRVERLPAMAAALADGATTLGHVTAVTVAANTAQRLDAIAEHDTTLAELARSGSPCDVKRAVGVIRDLVDPDGSEPAGAHLDDQGRDTRRELDVRAGYDGLGDARATLDPQVTELLWALLDSLTEPDPEGTPAGQRRTPTQRRADAFAEILRRASSTLGLPTVHGARPHVALTVDIATLLGLDDLATHAPRMRRFGEIEPGLARRLLLQAKITAVLTMGPWRIANLGRTMRVLPPWARLAVEAAHRHCRGPGCDRPFAWTQMGHHTDWARGGDTDTNHTIPVCQAHHTLLTNHGWTWTLDHDSGHVTWTSPHGHTLTLPPPRDPPRRAS